MLKPGEVLSRAMEYAQQPGDTSDENTLRALHERLRVTQASLQAVREHYDTAMGVLNESFYRWDIAHDCIFYS